MIAITTADREAALTGNTDSTLATLATLLGIEATALKTEMTKHVADTGGRELVNALSPEALERLLVRARTAGLIEDYCMEHEPRCQATRVAPSGDNGLSVRVELASGWLIEMDLPGAADAALHRLVSAAPWAA